MKFSIKKALLSGLLTVSVLASSLIAAIPVAAAASSITVESKSVANAATFNVTVSINSTVATAGVQAYLTYPAEKLQLNSSTFVTPSVFPAVYNQDPTLVAGQIKGLTSIIMGTQTVTPANVAWVTLNFTALTDDTIATIHMDPAIGGFGSFFMAPVSSDAMATDHIDGIITIGIPKYADLTVAGNTSGTGATYDLTATVTNNGTAAIATGTTIRTTYAINGGSAVNFSDIVLSAPLAIGASVTTAATGLVKTDVLTAGNTDSIALATDTANAVDEGANEGNNTNTTFYSVYPNLVISSVSTTPDQDTLAEGSVEGVSQDNYLVNYTVENTGIGVAAASSTQIKVNGVQVGELATCAALNPAASLSFTTGSITISGSPDVIVVTTDFSAVVTETIEVDNSNTVNFYFIASGKETELNDINGTLPLVFEFTSPGDVNAWNPTHNLAFTPGIDNTDYPGNLTMEVVCSKVWVVATKAQNDGFLTKWMAGTGYDTDTQLHNRLKIAAGTDQSSIGSSSHNLTGAAVLLANGDTMGLTGASGYSRTIDVDYTQPITYSDTTLEDGFLYHTVVTFTCTASGY